MPNAGRMAANEMNAATRKNLRNSSSPAALTLAEYSAARASKRPAASPGRGNGNSRPVVSPWKCATPQAARAARPKVIPIIRDTTTNDAAVPW